jgi:hypothetical protein
MKLHISTDAHLTHFLMRHIFDDSMWATIMAALYSMRVRGACVEGQRCTHLLAQILIDWRAMAFVARETRQLQGGVGPSSEHLEQCPLSVSASASASNPCFMFPYK